MSMVRALCGAEQIGERAGTNQHQCAKLRARFPLAGDGKKLTDEHRAVVDVLGVFEVDIAVSEHRLRVLRVDVQLTADGDPVMLVESVTHRFTHRVGHERFGQLLYLTGGGRNGLQRRLWVRDRVVRERDAGRKLFIAYVGNMVGVDALN